jgi:hypothetical protein
MKNKSLIISGLFVIATVFISIFFISCEKEIILDKSNDSNNAISEAIIENGYLNFSNQQSLDAYISSLSEQLESASNLKSTRILNTPKGFHSLADKIYRIDNKLKSATTDDEALNTELFFNELDKILIPEELLHYVVDTARRVKVAGEIYKITEAGTFIYTDDNTEEFENLYDGFLENYSKYSSKIDSCTYLYGNIKFIDSYNFVKNDNLSIESIITMVNGDKVEESSNLKSASERIVADYTSTYNLTNYHVGGSTAVGQFFASVGLNNWRSKEFDSEHRVNVNLYELNYGFFKCAGFKCKFQYKHHVKITVGIGRWKKTITLLSYWLETSADEMAIGFDYFKGYTQFTDFGLTPSTYNDALKQHSNSWANMATKIVFKGLLKEPEALLKDWVSDLHVFGGTVEIFGNTYTDTDAYKELYSQGYKWLTDEFKKKTSGFVYENTNQNKTAPAMMLSPGVGTNSNKEYLMINGVSNYTNKSEKTVRLGQPSFGISLKFGESNNWSPRASGFTPNAFKIEEAYVFGAVKYNGVWKGVRMYID